jgi:group I intron endonuclease
MGYIYKITNKITKKCYIGQTIMDLDDRWRQHCNRNSNCRYLKASIKKYGVDSFEFKLICICFDNDLNNYECFYMNKYNTLVPNGYNLREGGNSGRHHEETKRKISETLKNRTDIVRGKSQLGKPHTEEIKKKISNSLIGIKQRPESIQKRTLTISLYELTKKEEINNKISKSKKGNIKTSKIVEQYDLNGNLVNIFLSISDAANEINVCRSSIKRCCDGMYKNVKGYIWKFKNNISI